MNYADIHRMIQKALAGGYGLWVQLDSGDFELFGADLESTWDMLSPGEAFTVLGVVLHNDPEPYSNDFGYTFPANDPNVIYEGLSFNPRPEYTERYKILDNRSDVA